MHKKRKLSIFQIVITLIFILTLIIIHFSLDRLGIPTNDNRMMYLSGGVIFITISWLYIITSLQINKKPRFLEFPVWKKIPIIIGIITLLSIFGLFTFASFDIFSELLDKWRGLLYIIIIYFIILYFYFVMSLVYRFSETKNKVIHYTYTWSLLIILITVFMI